MKLIEKKENKIYSRTIYNLEMEYLGKKTPERKEVLELAQKELRIPKNLMVIKKIDNIYGKSLSKIVIHAYSSRDELEKNEPKHLVKRSKIEEESKENESQEPKAEEKSESA